MVAIMPYLSTRIIHDLFILPSSFVHIFHLCSYDFKPSALGASSGRTYSNQNQKQNKKGRNRDKTGEEKR